MSEGISQEPAEADFLSYFCASGAGFRSITQGSNMNPDNNNTQLIYGRHPVVDAIKGGTNMEKVLLQQGTVGDFEKEIRQLCRQHDVPLQIVPKERMNREGRGNHQGVIGIMSLISYYRIADVLPGIFEQSATPLLLLLDGVTDVRNLGAIARSADCCGVHAIIMAQKNSAQINADAIKTSAGALTRIPVCREPNLMKAIEYLQASGIHLFVSSLDATEPLHQIDLTVPLALVIGAEGTGVSPAVAVHADSLFVIPQKPGTESFNVSVAAGIMLYETMRQRG